MKTGTLLSVLAVVLLLAGCASPDLKQLRQDNLSLAAELSEARVSIEDLTARNQELDGEVESQRSVIATLSAEKGYRKTDSTTLRRQARILLKEQMKAIRDFATSSALLDYVGGEPIGRPDVEGYNVLLVDLQNRIPDNGAILEGRFLAMGPMKVSYCLLRPRDKKNLAVVWVSEPFDVQKAGLATNLFAETVAVQKGDVIGLYCPEGANVPFSSGVGRTRWLEGTVKTGQIIPLQSLSSDGPRMYSFGVAGLL